MEANAPATEENNSPDKLPEQNPADNTENA